MTTISATVKITPAMMAEAFWTLCSDEQVEFFNRLSQVIKEDHEKDNKSAYSLGELQWFYVGEELEKPENKEARDMLMTMAAPLYMHTLMACEKW